METLDKMEPLGQEEPLDQMETEVLMAFQDFKVKMVQQAQMVVQVQMDDKDPMEIGVQLVLVEVQDQEGM